jgi:hypothetical protein
MTVLETRPELFDARQKRLNELQAYSFSRFGAQHPSAILASTRLPYRPKHISHDLAISSISTIFSNSPISTELTGSLSYNQLIREHDMKQRIRKLRDYLSQCANPNDPSSFTAPAAQAVLDALINAFGHILAIPTAGLGHDGEIMLLWRNGNKSLEIEILPDQTIEFFGFNRDSEIAWEQSLSAEQTIPSNLLKMLLPFVTV